MFGSSPHTRGALLPVSFVEDGIRIIPAYAGSTPGAARCRSSIADHPRIRGEHGVLAVDVDGVGGSSPHTRGALNAIPQALDDGRIIPAYAGSTIQLHPRARSEADHPRIRGEHPIAAKPGNLVMGSSPHTRGAHDDGAQLGRRGGIIPAYAGSTAMSAMNVWNAADHPRIRGEHMPWGDSGGQHPGSSPHTRGARGRVCRHWGPGRIIPAYAGSTPCPEPPQRLQADHPRIRGEHFRPVEHFAPGPGSSPHTRGAPRAELYEVSVVADHPRIRGEHSLVHTDGVLKPGSSPHTRGAPRTRRPGCRRNRIIPAYAGSTRARSARSVHWWDHPRIRGEHYPDWQQNYSKLGSSPHTRGAPTPPQSRSRHPRIIPAYAGST